MPTPELESTIRRFAESECSWLSTADSDGKVHSAPVWHIWYEGHAYVVTVPTAVKVTNIKTNPRVVITHPDPLKVVIIEGKATIVEGMMERLQPYFKAKYDWDILTDVDYTTVVKIIPTKLIAWGKEGAGYRKRWKGEEVTTVP